MKLIGILATLLFMVKPLHAEELKIGDTQSKHEVVTNKVIKVYTVTEGKYKFIAYVTKWKGKEIVIIDTLAKSSYKIGEDITFLAQQISMKGIKSLSFSLLPREK